MTRRTAGPRGRVLVGAAAVGLAWSALGGAPAVSAAVPADAAAAVGPVLTSAGRSPAVAPRTAVSLTFDDGRASQRNAVAALDRVGLQGTFYVNSGFTGATGFLTRRDLTAMAATGHEIGGHTVQHRPFTTVTPAETVRQICLDRQNLTAWGLTARSFAYPFGVTTAAAVRAARDCGYTSARGLGDVRSAGDCPACATAGSFTPADPWNLAAPAQVESTWSLARLQEQVLQAEQSGGWMILTFHDVCDRACSDIATPVDVFAAFVSWLADRPNGTAVVPVGDVLGGPPRPVAAATRPPDSGRFGVNGVVNAALDDVDADGVPGCWETGGWGTGRARFRAVPDGRGGHAEELTMTGYRSGDAKLLPVLDLGECSATVREHHAYTLSARYTTTGRTQFAVYLRNRAGAWFYWTPSDWLPSGPGTRTGTFTTPPVPAGYTGMSFGLALASDGRLVTDDYRLADRWPAPLAPDAPPRLVPQHT